MINNRNETNEAQTLESKGNVSDLMTGDKDTYVEFKSIVQSTTWGLQDYVNHIFK